MMKKDKEDFKLYVIIIIQFFIPYFLMVFKSRIIDYSVEKNIIALTYLFLFLLATLVNYLLSYIFNYLLEKIFNKNDCYYDIKYIEKTSKITISELENNSKRKIIEEAKRMKEYNNYYLKSKLSVVFNIFQICSYFVFFGSKSYILLIIIAIILSICLVSNITLAKHTNNFWPKYIERMRLSKYYSRILSSRETSNEKKCFNYKNFIMKKFNTEFDNGMRQNKKIGKKRFLLELLQETIIIFSLILILLYFCFLLIRKIITIGEFISLFTSIGVVFNLLFELSSSIIDMRINRKKMNCWIDFLDIDEYHYDAKCVNKINTITFKNVYFKYPNSEKYVLNNLSMNISVNNNYAIVGENGCGKSTLVKLLLGYYSPEKGSIEFDGVNINRYSRDYINSIFGTVFQNSYIFPITIKEFLLSDDVNEERMNYLFEKMDLKSKIMNLEKGLDTELLLENKGTILSGGEFQKLSIIRCLLKDSKMILLDEPNSSLDPISEIKIYKLYESLVTNINYILISHRLGAVKHINNILVMKNGCIESFGTHDYLMKNSKYYYEMFESQKGLYYEKG